MPHRTLHLATTWPSYAYCSNRGHRAVVPRRDQIHMPFSDVRNEIR